MNDSEAPNKTAVQGKLAAIQLSSGPSISANLLEVERLTLAAVNDGAGLVVLPENFALRGKHDRELLAVGETYGEGRLQLFLKQLARKYGIWLVGGTIPLRGPEPNKIRAACLVYNDHGEVVGRYDKIHLFDVHLEESQERYEESAVIAPGDQTLLVETPFGRLGVIVCYDLRFPELSRSLSSQGLDVLAFPAAFTAVTGRHHWEILVRARAIEDLCYVVAAAQGGYHLSGRETYGHSMIVDPWGTILGQVGRGTGFVCATRDEDYQLRLRRNFPVLDHRRIATTGVQPLTH